MTYFKVVSLLCDADDCPKRYDYDRGRATEARETAATEGWTNHGSRDYCPDHGPEDR